MKTLALSLALILAPLTAFADKSNPDMDDSLDRPVARQTSTPKAKAPATDAVAGILTAVCRDGKSYYHPTGEHRGACSGHGGVASWADGSPVKSGGRKTSYR